MPFDLCYEFHIYLYMSYIYVVYNICMYNTEHQIQEPVEKELALNNLE